MTNWTDVGKMEDIPALGSRVVRRKEGDIALFRAENDEIYALDNKCPHKGGPLSEGIVHGCFITCPLHNWVMALDTGKARAPDEGQVKNYPVKVENGMVSVQFS